MVQRVAPAIEGRRVYPLAGRSVLGKDARNPSPTSITCPACRPRASSGRRPPPYYYNQGALPPSPDDWYSYVSRSDYCKRRSLSTSSLTLHRSSTSRRAPSIFTPIFPPRPTEGFWYAPQSSSTYGGSSTNGTARWASATTSSTLCSCMPMPRRLQGRRRQRRPAERLHRQRGFRRIHAGHVDQFTSLGGNHHAHKHLLWNGAVIHGRGRICRPWFSFPYLPLEQFQRQLSGCPGLWRGKQHQVPSPRA